VDLFKSNRDVLDEVNKKQVQKSVLQEREEEKDNVKRPSGDRESSWPTLKKGKRDRGEFGGADRGNWRERLEEWQEPIFCRKMQKGRRLINSRSCAPNPRNVS